MEKIKALFTAVWPYTFALFAGLTGLRLYEFFSMNQEVPCSFGFCLYGMSIDLVFSLLITAIYVLIQCLFFLVKLPRMLWIMHFFALSVLILNFVMIQYYLTAKIPLDEVIYSFSIEELKLIVGLENRLTWTIVLGFISLIALYFLLIFQLKKIKVKSWFAPVFGVLLIVSLVFPSLTYFEPTANYQKAVIVNNKLAYFAHRSWHYLKKDRIPDKNEVKISEFSKLDRNFYGGESLSKEYPLLHELPEVSEFAAFFNKSNKGAPNIVFIIVESLSTALVGEKADKTGHLLPFLDSLSKESLYWPNFLSTCDKTHNVLPASLASVPYATKGNVFQNLDFPNHWSMISLLNKDYFTRFFCGVDLNFSNMNGYMNYYKTRYIVKNWEKKFSGKFSERETPWGFPDGALFDKSWLDYKKQGLNSQKRLDVLLTISTHDPYVIPREQYYTDLVMQRLEKVKDPKTSHKIVRDNAYKFATFVYADEQLKDYFKEASKHKDFDNTIFLIFGDHGTESCLYDELSRYKIPLIIYSPLLKKPQTFRSVSSQLDLAPTLLNYLRLTYGVKLPSTVPFLGKELSYVKTFESNRSLVLGIAGLKDEHMIHKNHFLHHGELFKVKDGLEIEKDPDEKLRKKMIEQRRMCNLLSDYTIFGDKILPRTLTTSYTEQEEFEQIYHFSKKKHSKEALENEFIAIGENVTLPPDTKYIKIQFDCDYWSTNDQKPTELPKLTFSLENIANGKNETLIWKQIDYHQAKKFSKNAWNHLTATVTIDITDYKKLKKDNVLIYYLLNTEKQHFNIKNLETKILKDL